jgi:hypothetical protein
MGQPEWSESKGPGRPDSLVPMASRSHDADLDGEGDDEVYDDNTYDDSEDDARLVKPSIGERIRSGLQPGGTARTANAPPSATPRSSKQIVERLDDRERLFCFAAAALAVVAGIAIYLVETENKNFRLTKGELTPETTLVLGFVVGGLLLGATLLGRRAPVGFVALFGFLFFGTRYFAGIPFLVLAVWLLARSYKFQKEAAAARRAAMAEGATPPRAGTRGARGGSSSSGRAKSSTGGAAGKGPARPEANKRYTPKQAPPPPPKPSRRERKAAQASD